MTFDKSQIIHKNTLSLIIALSLCHCIYKVRQCMSIYQNKIIYKNFLMKLPSKLYILYFKIQLNLNALDNSFFNITNTSFNIYYIVILLNNFCRERQQEVIFVLSLKRRIYLNQLTKKAAIFFY